MDAITRAGRFALGKWSEFVWRCCDATVELPSGVKLWIKSRSDWEVFIEVFVAREYDEAILLALQGTTPDRSPRILDLGANVGLFSLRCLDSALCLAIRSPIDLIAVEGARIPFAQLERHCRLNDNNGHVTIHRGLIGKRDGEAAIYDSVYSCGNTVVPEGGKRSKLPFRAAHAVRSRYLDLDRIVPWEGTIDLIKCDIEGSELGFLSTYPDLIRRARYLALEIHPRICSLEVCHSSLRALGFAVRRTIRERATAVHYLFENAAGSYDWQSPKANRDVAQTIL